MVTTFIEEPFMKWSLDFIGLIKSTRRLIQNIYILIAIDYVTKWIEAKALIINNIVVITKFLYEYILTKFVCSLAIIIDQGVHFINDTIKHLTNQVMLKYVISTTYYPQ